MRIRPMVKHADGGLERPAQAGDGWLACPSLTLDATDGAAVIPAAAIVGGVWVKQVSTAASNNTTDTAANIIAAMPASNIGDTFIVMLSNGSASTLTIVGGTGVTVSGKSTIAGIATRFYHVTVTGAATLTFYGL